MPEDIMEISTSANLKKTYPSKNRSSSVEIARLHMGQVHVGVCSFNVKNVAASKHAVCEQYRDLHGNTILVIEIGSFRVNVSAPGTISASWAAAFTIISTPQKGILLFNVVSLEMNPLLRIFSTSCLTVNFMTRYTVNVYPYINFFSRTIPILNPQR
jgi:hypothetical protein